MLSNSHQGNLQKTLGFLALGVGVGISAMYVKQKLTTKSGGGKGASGKEPAETPKAKAAKKFLEVQLGDQINDKEELFE